MGSRFFYNSTAAYKPPISEEVIDIIPEKIPDPVYEDSGIKIYDRDKDNNSLKELELDFEIFDKNGLTISDQLSYLDEGGTSFLVNVNTLAKHFLDYSNMKYSKYFFGTDQWFLYHTGLGISIFP